jgi:hypothetical protein
MSGITASSGYREFVVKNTLIDIVAELEGI